ncbi:hypothetical protein [Flavobacterium sp. UMI-01]|nr:hypothetical protein [Flavobacterium sp. UMI-01]
MEKIKEVLNSPVGKIALVAVGFGIGFFIAKKQKSGRYARR